MEEEKELELKRQQLEAIEAEKEAEAIKEQKDKKLEEQVIEKETIKNREVSTKPSVDSEVKKDNILSDKIKTKEIINKVEDVKTEDIIQTKVKPLLAKHKIKFIDKRSKGGAFWILGGSEIKGLIDTFNQYGLKFAFAKNGGRATGHKPSWYTK